MTLVDKTLEQFVNQLAGDTPAPGGGSAAALGGSLGAALCAMAARLTLRREKYREVWKDMERVRDAADGLAKRLLVLVDRDTAAYNRVLAALRMPKDDEDLQAARQEALAEAYKEAALVPMMTLQAMDEMVELVGEALEKGNPNCIPDAGVAAQLIGAAAVGAAYNVRSNLSGIPDKGLATKLETEARETLSRISNAVRGFGDRVEKELG